MLIAGVDIETTGLDPNKARIIEIAIALFDGEGKKIGCYEQRFNPRMAIDPKAQAVHGITLESLQDCPLFSEHAERIAKLLSKIDVLVGHNGIGFDFPFIKAELKRAGFIMPDVIEFDTMLDGRWACEDGKQPRLSELAFACGFSYDTQHAHSALYDTELMMECFFYARDKYNLFPIRENGCEEIS